jgi:hypothetical protein
MKKKKTKPVQSTRRLPRRSVIIIAAIALLSVAAVTVISRQSASGRQAEGTQKMATETANAAGKKYTKVKVGNQEVFVDSQTGKIKPLTPQEAQELAQGLKTMLDKNKSSEGLVEAYHADGSVSIDLQGRFQNVTVARENEDGTVTTSCVDTPRAAANFFGIDPKLVESNPQAPKTVNSPGQ